MAAMPLSLLLLLLLLHTASCQPLLYSRDSACRLRVVESIPQNVTFDSPVTHMRTFDAYRLLTLSAQSQLHFASLYWSLRGQDVMPSSTGLAAEGEALYNLIANASRVASVEIAYNNGGLSVNMSDVRDLGKLKNVETVGLNFTRLFGTGVLHTKAAIADVRHAYVGSSNMDWRSLTQIKELGILLTDCPTLVEDIDKIVQTYLLTGRRGSVPPSWPSGVVGTINATRPWEARVGGYRYAIFVGASPIALCPPNRSRDLEAILLAIGAAKKFVHIAVMNYEAALPNYNTDKDAFWPVIDNALRAAAFRGVRVRLLVSHWRHSGANIKRFVDSLTALNNSHAVIEGKFFIVPTFTKAQAKIPFARVNHNKYLVTETTAVICTSNWDGSYFTNTAGMAVSVTQLGGPLSRSTGPSFVEEVQNVFMRDWKSKYAHDKPSA